jgi:6-phosphogluconolactonase (cycloisomerase 2 family)
MSPTRILAAKVFSLASLLAVLLCPGCGRGAKALPPVPSGSFLLAVDSAMQSLVVDTIATNGTLSSKTTAGTFLQPTKVLTLIDNIYTLNTGSSSISQFSISTSGAVSVGPSTLTGTGPVQFAFDPTSKFLVVANRTSKSLSIYSVASDGSLQSINNGFPLTFSPLSLAFAGDLLYVASSTGITGLLFDSSTGSLTVLSNFSLATANLSYLLADGSGTHLFATDLATNSVIAFSIASTTGILTQLPATPTGTGPVIMTFDPAGKFLYVVSNVGDDISVFSLDHSTGALTAVSGSPFPTLLAGANSVALDSNDEFIFVGSASGKQVAVLQVNSITGALTPVTSSPFAVIFAPAALAVIRPI